MTAQLVGKSTINVQAKIFVHFRRRSYENKTNR